MQAKMLALVILLTAASPVMAEGIPVEPGLWEMTSTINMPMMPQPRVTTLSECFTESEISMDDMSTDGLEGDCQLQMDQLEGNTMRWTVDCPIEGGSSHGEWFATSSGDTVTGEGKLTMAMAGQTMEMNMSWEGRRMGDCP